jgi:hypothetical protein
MTPETVLILKLTGQLIGKIGSSKRSNTTQGKLPPEIERKVKSYDRVTNLWSYADGDLLALLALVDLMWEKSIQPLSRKDENQLQLDLGVNALSRSATQTALSRMKDAKKQLELLKLKNDAIMDLAKVVAGRSLLGGVANASQITLDKLGCEEVRKRGTANIKALDPILKRLDSIIAVTEQTARAHGASP